MDQQFSGFSFKKIISGPFNLFSLLLLVVTHFSLNRQTVTMPHARAKTHKHTPKKYAKLAHQLHKYAMVKAVKQMVFRRGRKGRGMRGCGGDGMDEQAHLSAMKDARGMLANGASMEEVRKRFPMLQ